jgi:hypothetical protein
LLEALSALKKPMLPYKSNRVIIFAMVSAMLTPVCLPSCYGRASRNVFRLPYLLAK